MSQAPFRPPMAAKRRADDTEPWSSKKRRAEADIITDFTLAGDSDADPDDSVIYTGKGRASDSVSANLSRRLGGPSKSGHQNCLDAPPEPLLGSTSNVSNQANGNPSSSADRSGFYICTWRKPQSKKHKTWDGDGVLIIYNGGDHCSLKCTETCKELAKNVKYPGNSTLAETGSEMRIGNFEIEIQHAISKADYLRGVYTPTPTRPPFTLKTSAPKPLPFQPVSFTRSLKLGATAVDQTRRLALTAAASASRKSSSTSAESTSQPRASAPAVRKETVVRGTSAADFYGTRKEKVGESSSSTSPDKARRTGLGNSGSFTSKAPAARYPPDAPGAVVMRRPDKAHQQIFNKRGFPVVDVVLDPVITTKLRPHQVEGIKFLYECVMSMRGTDDKGVKPGDFGSGGILADSMGLGKTLQAIVLIQTLLQQSAYYKPASSAVQKVLVVCPLSLIGNWKREFVRWTGKHSGIGVCSVDGTAKSSDVTHFTRSKNAHVLIIGYEKLRSCIGELKGCSPPIGLIVCDEGHRLKSKDAKTTKMFEELHTPRRIILSGTPVQNDLSELYAMVDFVSPGILGEYPVFKKIFEDPIVRSREHNCTKKVRDEGKARSDQLVSVTKRIVLRRGPEVLEAYLLPKCELVLFCSPSQEQLALYRAVLDSGLVRQIVNGDAGISPLVLIDKLRKLCNAPILLMEHLEAKKAKGDEVAIKLYRQLRDICPKDRMRPGDATTSGKLVVLANLLQAVRETTEDKFVIVSNFTATLDVIQQLCQRLGYKFARLDGSTPQKDRTDIVASFNRATPAISFVCLLSAKAGGVGLNLIGANRLVLFDSDWNPSTDKQAMARIHRDGQRKHCFIYRMLLTGTMDEKIYQRQISKIGLSDSLIDDDTNSSKDAFSAEELRDIFRLHTDTKCLTHDHLGCSCDGVGKAVGAERALACGDGNASDDNDDLPLISFVQASQIPSVDPSKNGRDHRAKLAALFDWAHLDCTKADNLGTLTDQVLLKVLRKQIPAASTSTCKTGQPSSDTATIIIDSDVEMEEAAEQVILRAKRIRERQALAKQLDVGHAEALTEGERRARAKALATAVADTSSSKSDAHAGGGNALSPPPLISRSPAIPIELESEDEGDVEGEAIPPSQWTMQDAPPGTVLYIYSKASENGTKEGKVGSEQVDKGKD